MLTLGKKSKMSATDVIDKAINFFGPSGLGLTVQQRSDCCVTFSSQVAFVTVEASDLESKGSDVHIETREFEFSAKEFLNKI